MINSIKLSGDAATYGLAFVQRLHLLLGHLDHASPNLPALPVDMSQWHQASLLLSIFREAGIQNPVGVLSCCPSENGCSGEFITADQAGTTEYTYQLLVGVAKTVGAIDFAETPIVLNYAPRRRITSTDRISAKATKPVNKAMASMMQEIIQEAKALDSRKLTSAEKYSRLLKKLNSKAMYKKLVSIGETGLADTLAQAMTTADLAGRYDVLAEGKLIDDRPGRSRTR